MSHTTDAGLRVASIDQIADGESLLVSRQITGADDDIAIFRNGDRFYALDDTCTHERASLAEGWIEEDEVECPVHTARFCLATGRALCLPATRDARTHHVQVQDQQIWLFPGTPAQHENS